MLETGKEAIIDFSLFPHKLLHRCKLFGDRGGSSGPIDPLRSPRSGDHSDRQQQIRINALFTAGDGQAHIRCRGGIVEFETLDLLKFSIDLRSMKNLTELSPDLRIFL